MGSVTEAIPAEGVATSGPTPRPMIVAQNAHVEYRVHASGKRLSTRESMLSLRALRGGRELQTVPALRGVSFTASEGESIGVVGHNGSGKSTLFRAMSGLIPTSEGSILARERPVLLGVNAALVPELSGENNIKLGLLAMGYTVEEAAARVDEIADFAELNEFIHHPMRTYSSGMGARLRFAIASAKAHSILLVDEALSVGDRRFKMKSEERIRGLRDGAGLVMIVSHSLNSIRDTCERVLWIHKGELVGDGPAKDVVADYVKWTKKPGGAVGAASSSKPAPRLVAKKASLAASTAVEAAHPPDPDIDRSSDIAELQEMLAASGATDATTTGSAFTQTIGLRTIARRDRYRHKTRERQRRRLIAIGISVVAILLAVGAGAAIALLTRAPAPAEPSALPSPSAMVSTGPPTITSFAASAAAVECAAPDGTVPVQFTWRAEDARLVAIAAGTTEVDAIEAPLESTLPMFAAEYVAAFPCTDEARTYTLTAEGADGTRVSSTVTVNRELTPTPEPELETPVTPVEPAPQPDPVEPPEPVLPSEQPSQEPSEQPSQEPSEQPSQEPSEQPSQEPSEQPSQEPSDSSAPSEEGGSAAVPSTEPTEP